MNRLEKQKQFEREFIQRAEQLHNDKYDYSNVVYVNSRTKVKIICSKHGEFEQLPSSHLQGNGCPKCAREWTDEHKYIINNTWGIPCEPYYSGVFI